MREGGGRGRGEEEASPELCLVFLSSAYINATVHFKLADKPHATSKSSQAIEKARGGHSMEGGEGGGGGGEEAGVAKKVALTNWTWPT